MQQVWSIQYLRAVAALGVVIYHSFEASRHLNPPGANFEIGAAGVDIFFVVSGFIMASLMLNNETRPGEFLWRRLIRIAPLYWLASLAAVTIDLIRPGLLGELDASLRNTLLTLAFLPHESAGAGPAPVLWQGWTLEYEMFFYVLCGLALLAPRANRLKYLCALLVALVTIGFLSPSEHRIAQIYTGPLLLEFVAGVGLGAAWRESMLPRPIYGVIMVVLGLGVYSAQQLGALPLVGVRALDWGAPALLIVAGALSIERGGWAPRSKSWLILGDASYSLYLTHGFAISGVLWVFSSLPLASRVALCVAASIVVALCSYFLVERPITTALKRFPQRNPRAAATAG